MSGSTSPSHHAISVSVRSLAIKLFLVVTKMSWAKKPIKGVLLDITGVLYDGTATGGQAISGSVEAVDR